MAFPFLAGHVLNTDRFLEPVTNRKAPPRVMPLQLALGGENVHFLHMAGDSDVRELGHDDDRRVEVTGGQEKDREHLVSIAKCNTERRVVGGASVIFITG